MFGYWKQRYKELNRNYMDLQDVLDTTVANKRELERACAVLKQDNAGLLQDNSKLQDDYDTVVTSAERDCELFQDQLVQLDQSWNEDMTALQVEHVSRLERLTNEHDDDMDDANGEIKDLEAANNELSGRLYRLDAATVEAEDEYKRQLMELKIQLEHKTQECEGWRSRAERLNNDETTHAHSAKCLATAIDNLWTDAKGILDDILGEKL